MNESSDPAGGHLSPDEIAAALESNDSALPPERTRHLESCDSCKSLLAMNNEEDFRIRKLAAGPYAHPEPNCPETSELAMLAAGLVSGAESQRLLAHASTCDCCGAILRAATNDFSADPQPGDALARETLRTASASWQRKFARKLAAEARQEENPVTAWRTASWFAPRWLAQAAAVILVLGGGWWGYTLWSARQPEQWIAAAYTGQRPFEFRIPGAAHAPVRVEKRSGGSSFSRAPELLRAVDRIAEELKKSPDDTRWLSLRARAEMLEWDADAAVSTFTRALDQSSEDPTILAGLGMAHALRAEAASRSVDYGYAIEYLSRALKARADDRETLFNRAIVYERMFLYEEALKDWEHYLKLDSQGPWAEEARRHKTEIENKKKAREEALNKISSDPAAFLARLDHGEAVEPEPYLEFLILWLSARSSNPKAGETLERLAELFQSRHQDPWLANALAGPDSAEGVSTLAEAYEASRASRSRAALEKYTKAADIFRSVANYPLALMAERGRVYGLHRTFRDPARCVQHALALERDSASRGYRWIEVQAALELGVCRAIQGQSGPAYEDMNRALRHARLANYKIAALRADGILAESQAAAGDMFTVWNRIRAGLEKFWTGTYPGASAQQLHFVLRRAAEGMTLPHAARAFNSAQVSSVAGSQHQLLEAIGRVMAAGLALDTGDPQDAKREYDAAEMIFAKLGSSSDVETHRMRAELYRAQVDTQLGQPSAALARLEPLRAAAMNLDSVLVKTMFHEVTGLAYLRDHQPRQSEREFRAAVSLHENKLATLSRFDERALAARTLAASFRGIADIEWTQNRNPGAAFWTMERFRSPSAISTPRPEEFHNETFVSYADLPSGLAVWLFDDRGLSGTRLDVPTGQVAAAARRLTRLCANPDSLSSQINAESRKLYQWLLGAVTARLEPGRTLVIIPDESTAGVTFSALLDEHDRYVGDRFPTVVASSVADYSSRLRSGPVERSARSLIVANPLLGAGATASFPPLHQAEKEGRVVASRLTGATLLSGPEATLGALDQHRASTALLHFAGHGFSNAGNGGLILAPPPGSSLPFDVLDGSRLADQDWSRCRLAVLSACSSGTGESAGPVNPESLVRRLLWAGASRVVAGRWNLDAESSFSLVDRFYSALGKGRDVPEALQVAAREVRGNPATAHPYYWAGFQTFGSR